MPPEPVPSTRGVDGMEGYRAQVERVARLIYEYKHGEPPGDRTIGPGWDCWKVAESVLNAADHRGAVDDREHLIALLHRIDHRLAADPQACGMCAKVRAALPSGGNDAA